MPITRVAVQKAIVDILSTVQCHPVSYNVNGFCDPVESTALISPGTIEANEISGTLTVDRNDKRTYRQKRDKWIFNAYIEFNREVSIDPIVDVFTSKVQSININAEHAFLVLEDYTVNHPTRQNQEGGTVAVLKLSVTQTQ